MLLTFIEFTRYQTEVEQYDEDEALWAAVEANRVYKRAHPDQIERHKTGAEFMAAVAGL